MPLFCCGSFSLWRFLITGPNHFKKISEKCATLESVRRVVCVVRNLSRMSVCVWVWVGVCLCKWVWVCVCWWQSVWVCVCVFVCEEESFCVSVWVCVGLIVCMCVLGLLCKCAIFVIKWLRSNQNLPPPSAQLVKNFFKQSFLFHGYWCLFILKYLKLSVFTWQAAQREIFHSSGITYRSDSFYKYFSVFLVLFEHIPPRRPFWWLSNWKLQSWHLGSVEFMRMS